MEVTKPFTKETKAVTRYKALARAAIELVCLFLQRAATQEEKASEISGLFGTKLPNAHLVTLVFGTILTILLIAIQLNLKGRVSNSCNFNL